MTGIELNAEALADKEYLQDEAALEWYERRLEHLHKKKKTVEQRIQEYTDKILDIQRKRLTREAQ